MLLFSPGPSTCHPMVRSKEALPLMHHRSDEFKAIYNSIVAQMKLIIQAKDCELVIQNGSGSTGMETSLMNLFHPHDLVIVIHTGYFGERFLMMAKMLQLEVLTCAYTNTTYQLSDVVACFEKHPHIKGVLVTHSDTSNGVLNNIHALGELCHQYDALLVVDAIGGIIMNPIHFDHDYIDCLIMASQKGFMMPPGLSMVALSSKAMQLLQSKQVASYTFNFLNIINKFHDDARINTTPAISLYLALHEALCILNQYPISVWNHYYENLHQYLVKKIQELPITMYGTGQTSHSLVVIELASSIADTIQKQLIEQYDVRIELGLQDPSNRMLRIGCMNYLTTDDIDKLCCALHALLKTS